MAHRPTDFDAGKLKPMAQRSGSRRYDSRQPWEEARDRYAVERGGAEGRKARANSRAEARGKLSPREQLDELDARLGKGAGAARERARLAVAAK